MQGWVVVAVALAYLSALFAVAAFVDRKRPAWLAGQLRPFVYALGLGVYCTSWSFYGAVGFAATSGWSFLALAVGPALVFLLFGSLVRRVIRVSKTNNITSIADFIGSRYGKSETVAGLVAVAAILGVVPYIALQLNAISMSLAMTLAPRPLPEGDAAIAASVVLAAFAMLFGTRQAAATENQHGLMAAIAVESVVKLATFLLVGAYVVFVMFGGPADLIERASAAATAPFARAPNVAQWIALALLSFSAFLILPRQFHVIVVESHGERDVGQAKWLFPAYLALFSLFVAPLALAGLVTFGAGGNVPADHYVLALPLQSGAGWIAVAAFVGGLSAASAMVIMESIALAVMISNDLAMPVLLRGRSGRSGSMTNRLIVIRRAAIVAVIFSAFVAHRLVGPAELASIGLVSMAAIAQLAPAFFGGLVWRRANARGALAGIAAGLLTCTWTLIIPALVQYVPDLYSVVVDGPFGLAWLRPEGLLGLSFADPLSHGVIVSLTVNSAVFVLASLTRSPLPLERQQAAAFIEDSTPVETPAGQMRARPWRSRATASELAQTVARYLGAERTETAFRGFAIARGAPLQPNAEIDLQSLRFAEHLLASAIGAASSRLVLSMLLTRRNVTTTDALKLLDDASAAMQTNRDVLQNALDHARQGVTAIDRDMKLVCWNRQFRELFELPEEMIHFGVGLDDIFRFNVARGLYGPINPEEFIADRIERFVVRLETLRTRLYPSGRVIEIRSNRMPDGGVVTTYTDISDTVAAQEALERSNENLERRVRERTRELTKLNQALARAKTEADEANISKTRFLAAASHDILQPLNAARLFATSLVERGDPASEQGRLARNVDSSLDAVEEILSTLLDISRLDTGVMRPDISNFRLDDITSQLAREFAPVAAEKGLTLKVLPTSATVRSDRRLLRRVLQNLLSNAIKYTPSGRVIVGCRVLRGKVRIEVWDTGLGIASGQQKLVFREFKRLEQGAKVAPGVGLGLSIVERIARILDHPITLRSRPGHGSVFALEAPTATAMPTTRPADAFVGRGNQALRGLVVLAIDNEPAILEGMTALLGGWGCEALTAPNQREAEKLLTRQRVTPDVIIADYHLDESDGIETIVSLRWKLGRPIPAVLVTADRSPGVRETAAARDVHMLMKPLRPAALRALLAQLTVERIAAAE